MHRSRCGARAHAQLQLVLVRGNHDDRAGDPPSDWGIDVVAEPHLLAPFLACHIPMTPPTGYALCGHVHPGVFLRGTADTERLPCFVLGARRAHPPRLRQLHRTCHRDAGRGRATRGGRGHQLFALPA
jgi:metallophosphoesterase superfamily enzyme